MPNFAAIFAGLDLSLVITSVIAGLLWGYIYNRRENLSPSIVYHKFFTGTAYLLIILLSRFVTGGAIGPWERWVGFIMLWGMFCLFIRIGMGKQKYRSQTASLEAQIRDLKAIRRANDAQISRLLRERNARG